MLNSVVLQGRIANDLEIKQTQSGINYLIFALAVEEDILRKNAEKKVCHFLDCHAWGKTAELIYTWKSKGDPLIVTGRMETDSWTDNNGNKRKSVYVRVDSVYFISGGKKDGGNNAAPASRPVNVQSDPDFDTLEDDDELPF